MMNYAIAGGALMGASQLSDSQLDRNVSKLRAGFRKAFRWFIDTITQKGDPNDY